MVARYLEPQLLLALHLYVWRFATAFNCHTSRGTHLLSSTCTSDLVFLHFFCFFSFFITHRSDVELELELIQTQMAQKPMLRAEVGMRVRCANKASAE